MIPTLDLANSLSGGQGDGSIPGGSSSPHRYWRLINIVCPDSPPGFFEISEIEVYAGATNKTGDATKTSSSAPDTIGVLANLFDGNTSTRATWTLAVAEDAAFWIKFDFGSGNNIQIDGLKQAGFDNAGRYMQGFTVQYSDDNSVWTTLVVKSGLSYPGDNTLSSLYPLP